nr:DinB family protein [Ardenticatena sp.]
MSDLAHRLEANRKAFISFLQTLNEERANRPLPHNPSWRVRDVLAHLAASEAGMLKMVQIMVAKKGYQFRPYNRDELNAQRVAERASKPLDAILAEWEQARNEMIETVKRLTDEELAYQGSDGGSNWGEFTTRDIIETAIRHTEDHIKDLVMTLLHT